MSCRAGNGADVTGFEPGTTGGRGGGLASFGGSPTLERVAIVACRAGGGGAGLGLLGAGGPGGAGGGLYAQGDATLTRCFVSDCRGGDGGYGGTLGGSGGHGGGLALRGGVVALRESVVTDCESGIGGYGPTGNGGSAGDGGGIFADGVMLLAQRTKLTRDRSGIGGSGDHIGAGGVGGGVALVGCDATFARCEIAGCEAGAGFSGISFGSGRPGGGLHAHESTVRLVDSVVRDNAAGDALLLISTTTGGHGGGLAGADATFELLHCTLGRNAAGVGGTPGQGGAIALTGSSTATIANSILWGDLPDEISGGTVVVTSSDVAGGFAGDDNLDADPLFVDPAGGDLRLTLGSPAVDAGSAAVPGIPLVDVAGRARMSGLAPDMGAHELIPVGLLPGSGADLVLESRVNGGGEPASPLAIAAAGDGLELRYRSPLGTLAGVTAFLAAQVFPSGSPVNGPPAFPEVHLDPIASPMPYLVVPAAPLPTGNVTLAGIVPPGIEGAGVRFQVFAEHAGAANGIFVASDAHEVRVVSRPAPTIVGVTPSSPTAGAEVTVVGTGFTGATVLTVAGFSLAPTLLAPGIITFAASGGVACDVPLVVANPDGQSATAPFNPSPVITGSIGDPGPTVGGELTLVGQGLVAGSTVTIGGVAAAVVAADGTSLVLTTPPGAVGTVPLVLTTPTGCTASATHPYASFAPLVQSVSPTVATVGAPVLVVGQFFVPGLTVTISGILLPMTFVTHDLVAFPFPAGIPCDATLVITNPDGQSIARLFNPGPILVSLNNPSFGGPTSSTRWVTGQHLLPGSTVTVGGAPAPVLAAYGEALVFQVPPGPSGPTTVVVTSASGCSASIAATYR